MQEYGLWRISGLLGLEGNWPACDLELDQNFGLCRREKNTNAKRGPVI